MGYQIKYTGLVQYIGEINASGLPHGYGTIQCDGSVVYEGEFREGKKHGKGTLYWENGIVRYAGSFSDGKRSDHPTEGQESTYKVTQFYPGTSNIQFTGGYWLGLYQGFGDFYD